MVRECLLAFAIAPLAGCSLILDFSSSAVPIDAQIDAPYTQEQCDFLEPNDSPDVAMDVSAMPTGTAAICAGQVEDHDFYKFTVPANTAKVEVKITFMNRPSGDLDLKLDDMTGMMIAQSRGFGDSETISCPATSPACPMLGEGTYIFEVFPALTGAVNNYDFSVTLTPM